MIRSLRKAVEAGVMVGAVSALLLTGCGGGGGSTGNTGNSTVSNAYISALTDGVGLRTLSLAASPVVATIVTATPGASGSYTVAANRKVWNGSAWQAMTPVVSGYTLSSSGSWVGDTGSSTFTPNADGSITSDWGTETMVGVDLSGSKIKTGMTYNLIDPAISGGSAVISVGVMPVPSASATYPSGSTAWMGFKMTYATDQYQVYSLATPVKTPAGNLTTLNFADASSYTLSNPVCVMAFQLVYSATQPGTANTARFDVYQGACATVAGGATTYGTVDLFYKTARTQSVAVFTNYTGALSGWFSQSAGNLVIPTILALINGGVWTGSMYPAGTNEDILFATGYMHQVGSLNKTAMDAVLSSVGAPSF